MTNAAMTAAIPHRERGVVGDALTYVILVLFLFGVMFPFFKITPFIGSDTQPLALVLGAILLVSARTTSFPAPLTVLILVAVLSSLLLSIGEFGIPSLRNWSNYISLAVIAATTWAIGRCDAEILRRAVTIGVVAWFVAGAIQTFAIPDFGGVLLISARTSTGRGGVGLAPEPTMYALQCLLFMFVINIYFTGAKQRLLNALCLVQIIFFARSSMGVMLLLLWAILLIAAHAFSLRGVLLLGAAFLAAPGAYWLVSHDKIPLLAHSRLQALAVRLIEDPRYVFFVDESGASRAGSLVYALAGFMTDGGRPHGFAEWAPFTSGMAFRFADVFPSVPSGNRAMSGYGAALFELGFLGLLIPLAATYLIAKFYVDSRGAVWATALIFHAALFTSVPLATPLVGFFLGTLAVRPRVVDGSLRVHIGER